MRPETSAPPGPISDQVRSPRLLKESNSTRVSAAMLKLWVWRRPADAMRPCTDSPSAIVTGAGSVKATTLNR